MKKYLIVLATIMLAAQVQAAVINPHATLNVGIDRGTAAAFGVVGQEGYYDWALQIGPDGRDAQITSLAVEFSRSQGALEVFSREQGDLAVDGWVSQSSAAATGGFLQVATLTFMALDAFDYVLRVSGSLGAGHLLAVQANSISAVPLPGAAWMFMSALLGGVFFTRGSKRSEAA